MDKHDLIFYHAPHSRSLGVRILLEELGAPYTLHALNMKADEQRKPAYLAVNPMGKVPAIVHKGELVSEQVAVFLYLADLFPKAKLAPGVADRLRGTYLRWMVYYAASFEPAVVDHALKREAPPVRMSPYGDYDTVMKTLNNHLQKGPYILGDVFSAADILWATALTWTTGFKVVPETPVIMEYIARINQRPAVVKVKAEDEKLAQEMEKAA